MSRVNPVAERSGAVEQPPAGQLPSWGRYWTVLARFDPNARSPIDVFVDKILGRARQTRWLDAGCGRQTLPAWRSDEFGRLQAARVALFGCDGDVPALRDRREAGPVCGAILEQLPFKDKSFGLVTSNMVFEHLVAPERSVEELVRVTASGGRILVLTVNRRHYLALLARLTPHWFHCWIVRNVEGRASSDVYPTVYCANTVERLRRLFEGQGCRLVDGGLIEGIPLNLPYRGLFWVGMAFGLVERRLARLPLIGSVLCHNILIEFERP